ncbi:hypothetical protein GCM10009120_07790 [Sphingobacterium siyangense subsp. cladoniae]|uniref:hypothetical protein n=1 Tax=Sphingobacterium siyangense TaxID=459529 RepID=UPI0031F7E47B
MTVTIETKKRIAEDWLHSFPQLSRYQANKFYKIIGPVVIGVELIKLPRTEEYRPHYVMYPLWRANLKQCLDAPIILSEFKNNKNLQYNIPYESNHKDFQDAIFQAKSQRPTLISDRISYKEILSEIKHYAENSYLKASPNSYWQALLKEAQLIICLYVDSEEANAVLKDIRDVDWNVAHFKNNGVDKAIWIEEMGNLLKQCDSVLSQIRLNQKDSKICKLPYHELIK